MFEKIILRKSDTGPALTPGELAEAMLFYQHVHLILDYSSLHDLGKKLGIDQLMSLLSRPSISAVYCDDMIGTQTDSGPFLPRHSFIAFQITSSRTESLETKQRRIEYVFKRIGADDRRAKRLAQRFREKVPIRRLGDNYFLPGGIISAANSDVTDQAYVHEAVRRVLKDSLGEREQIGNFLYRIDNYGKHFEIATDLDFDAINSKVSQKTGVAMPGITPAFLANHLLSARADMALASRYGGEFYTADVTSEIIRLRYEHLLTRIGIDLEELRQFHEVVIPESPSIRGAINNGSRSFSEFLNVLDKSHKFKDWIRGVNPDEKLVSAYLRDVTAESWINRLPGKAIRYILTSGIGALAPLPGLGISAADSFLVEKIFRGWRPNHFVESQLKPFVNAVDN